MKFDLIIIGAGPSGIFTALELVRRKSSQKILIVEEGKRIEERACLKEKTKYCNSCKPYCHITTGFSGAGAFSDGKLSLSHEVGGDLPELIGRETVQDYIAYTDRIYLEFGADKKVEGLENTEAIKDIRRKAIEAGLKLVDCPIRHLGTEKAQGIYRDIQHYLLEAGVEILFDTTAIDIVVENGRAIGVKIVDAKTKTGEQIRYGNRIIAATGRKGAAWLEGICERHGINRSAGAVDIGVRVEVRNEVMERINHVLYESKLIGYPAPYRDKVRTFCQNPGGFVSQENYDGDLAIVNGHSYKNKKSENTNLAILSSHKFSQPFNQPIQYGRKVAKLVNMLGDGKILVQRYGDILDGKRTWQHELAQSNVQPTLPDAVAGDLTSAIPYRPMTNILKFIEAMNIVVPGIASRETLLYGPEIKFYSNKIALDQKFETNIQSFHCLGDASGWTRGLMMASVMGAYMGQILYKEEKGLK